MKLSVDQVWEALTKLSPTTQSLSLAGEIIEEVNEEDDPSLLELPIDDPPPDIPTQLQKQPGANEKAPKPSKKPLSRSTDGAFDTSAQLKLHRMSKTADSVFFSSLNKKRRSGPSFRKRKNSSSLPRSNESLDRSSGEWKSNSMSSNKELSSPTTVSSCLKSIIQKLNSSPSKKPLSNERVVLRSKPLKTLSPFTGTSKGEIPFAETKPDVP